jgi:hypothetical protein
MPLPYPKPVKAALIRGLGRADSVDKDAPLQHEQRTHMAADLDLEKETAVHRKGYTSFIGMMKWGTIISMILAAIVVLIIRA